MVHGKFMQLNLRKKNMAQNKKKVQGFNNVLFNNDHTYRDFSEQYLLLIYK